MNGTSPGGVASHRPGAQLRLNRDSELDRVVWCVNEILFRAKIPFGRLNGGVA